MRVSPCTQGHRGRQLSCFFLYDIGIDLYQTIAQHLCKAFVQYTFIIGVFFQRLEEFFFFHFQQMSVIHTLGRG